MCALLPRVLYCPRHRDNGEQWQWSSSERQTEIKPGHYWGRSRPEGCLRLGGVISEPVVLSTRMRARVSRMRMRARAWTLGAEPA